MAQVFPCEFGEISKNTFFLQNTSGGYFCNFFFFRDYMSIKNRFVKQLYWAKIQILGFVGFAAFQNLTAVWFKINVW